MLLGICIQPDLKPGGNLKEELETIGPLLEDMRRKKVERINQFIGVIDQIQKISNEILGFKEQDGNKLLVDETNLSLRRLEELHRELHELQNEKVGLHYDHLSLYDDNTSRSLDN